MSNTDGITCHPLEEFPDQAVKGRGAVSNRTNRFEPLTHQAVDDGWQRKGNGAEEGTSKLRTQLFRDHSKRIINYHSSPDLPFDRTINPYRGCEHGCVYCYARPSHAYLGFSSGLDFESRLLVKPEAPDLLRRELGKKGYQCQPIALAMNTDGWQPIERRIGLTRRVIQVLKEFNHPFGTVTKSALIQRDLDLLTPMAERRLVGVAISITSLAHRLANRLEPRASTPTKRLETIQKLASAGIPVTVMAAPMIPGLNDHELDNILAAAQEAGARHAGYALLRLPHDLRDLFTEWLEAHAPNRKKRVLSLIRQCREGKLYQSEWRKRRVGTGAYADLLAQRFRLARIRLGLDGGFRPLDCDQFAVPPQKGDQMGLL